MQRDARLHGLSSDHHQALVLARRLEQARAWTREDGARLSERFDAELEPHFRVEEELLVPALRDAGLAGLAERTLEDHAFLRASVAAARDGDGEAARAFAERLREHVRFEERELFVACERSLPPSVLDAVAHAAPK